jgi:hypothetical protein
LINYGREKGRNGEREERIGWGGGECKWRGLIEVGGKGDCK